MEEENSEGEEDSEDEEEMCLPGMDGKEEVGTKEIETNCADFTS